MQEIFKICGLAIMVVLLANIVKTSRPDFSFLIIISAGCVLIFQGLALFQDVIVKLQVIREDLGSYEEFLGLVIRITGIAYVCQFSSSICRDAGYGSLGEQIEIMGKLWILFSGFPVVLEIIARIKMIA